MNRNSPTISPTSTFKRYETAFNKDKDNKLLNSQENFNSNFWRTQNLEPSFFNILTPSPLPNFSIPNISYDEKTKRFEDWPLSDMCLNPNVNRNMEIMIEKKLNFCNSDVEDEDDQNEQEIREEEMNKRKKSREIKCTRQQKQQREMKGAKPKPKNDIENFEYYFTRDNKQKKVRPKDKGLRRLSEKSFEIVQVLGSTSYKQVAIKLINELESESEMYRQEKQEQNIKRRVYDALNVLIALGILRKEGRQIIYDRNSTKYTRRNEGISDKLKKQQNMVQLRLERKKKQLHILQEKALTKELVTRNIIRQSQKRINVPFLAVLLEDIESKNKMEDQGEKIVRQDSSTQTILKLQNKKLVKSQESKDLMKFIKL